MNKLSIETTDKVTDEGQKGLFFMTAGAATGADNDEDTKVTLNGNEFDFDAVVKLMDDDIREELEVDICGCTAQEFVDVYAERHEDRYGEKFIVN